MRPLAVIAVTVLLAGCWVTETEIVTARDSRPIAGPRLTMPEDNGRRTAYLWNAARSGYIDAQGNLLIRLARLKGDAYIAQIQSLKPPENLPPDLTLPDRPVYMVMVMRLAPPRLVAQTLQCGDSGDMQWMARAYGVEPQPRNEYAIKGSREATLGLMTGALDCKPDNLEIFEMTADALSPGGPELAELGTKMDRGRYVQHFEQRCNAGDREVCLKLAQTLRRGDGIPADPRRAIPVLEKLCDSNYVEACVDLAVMLDKGEGTSPNSARATDLLKKACAGGEMYGCDLLKRRK